MRASLVFGLLRSAAARPLALAALSLATGCGGPPGTGEQAGARRLRTHLEADPAMIDPITYSELLAGDVIGNMYESFAALDESGETVPSLATSWEVHEDHLGFRFHLRRGVRFHSGRELTGHDVAWSLAALLIPGNRGGLNAKYAAAIEGADAVRAGETDALSGVTVVDDHTVDIRFGAPEVLFPIYPIYIMDRGIEAEHGKQWWRSASAGTGPFRFESWDRGRSVRLAAHEAYWDGAPQVAGVDFYIVPSDETAISMYEADELDLVLPKPPATRRVLQDPSFEDERVVVPSAQIQYLGMNQSLYEPFRDIRVREAVCRALDRSAMSEGLFYGASKPLAGQITEGVFGHDPELEPVSFDPGRARRLLVEAGYPGGDGLPPLAISGTEPHRLELAYYADQLGRELGMPVEVEVVERGTHLQAMNAGQVAFFPWAWSAAYPDGLYFLRDVWYGPSPYNRSRWRNETFDALIERASRTPGDAERLELYHRAERVLLDDWGTCPTVVEMHVALVKPDLEGVSLTAFRFLPFGKARFAAAD